MPKVVTSRKEIIKHSRKLFLDNGYHATSISMLSEACAIQKAHFYYYFKNKEALMKAVLDSTRFYFQKEVYEKIIDQEIPSSKILEEVLQEFEKTYIKLGGCIIGNTILETAHLSSFQAELIGFMDDLAEVLRELYYLKYDGDHEKAQRKTWQTIQDIQGGIMLMRLYSEDQFLKAAINRAKI